MSQANLHETAPTRFQDIGDVRLAYRRFGKEGAPPLVCLQHFTGRMDNWDPIHTNRLAQDRPVVLVDYAGVGRSSGETPDSMQGMGRDIIAFIRALVLLAPSKWISSGSRSEAWSLSRSPWMPPSLSGDLFSQAPVRRVARAWLHSRRRCRRSLIGRTARQPNGCWSCSSHRPSQARPRARRGLPASQRGTRIANRLHRPRSPPPSWPR